MENHNRQLLLSLLLSSGWRFLSIFNLWIWDLNFLKKMSWFILKTGLSTLSLMIISFFINQLKSKYNRRNKKETIYYQRINLL